MATAESLALGGCTPTPLASYLKAIGVLRLISSDANHVNGCATDLRARGWWENEYFHLTTTLDRSALINFFLDDYAPSPIIAPWNGGSGFYPKDNRDGFEPLTADVVAERFLPIEEAIRIASSVIAQLGLTKQPKKDAKIELVAALRAELPDPAIHWIDAVLALSGESLNYPQLLGSGGNDGRLDFTNNFMRRLVSKKRPLGILDAVSGKPSDRAKSLLSNALFDIPTKGLESSAIGQFAPGAAGGPNATAGYKADGNVNPWDFILMLEGAVAFAGAATRRHQGRVESGASFPFTVRAVGAGWGGVEATDENDARAEFWAPLWRRPVRFRELEALLAEGRAVLTGRTGRTARDGLDFARAAASLGVSRGFSEFERYGFLMRAGKAFLAAPVGRRSASPSLAARLVTDLDANGWLERVRRVGRSEGASATARNSIKRFEDALFALVEPVSPRDRIEQALVALGDVCHWLSASHRGREAVGTPPPVLSGDWIRMADDGSAEFRVAAALAGLGLSPVVRGDDTEIEGTAENKDATDGGAETGEAARVFRQKAPPMAAHFAPIDEDRFFDGRRLRLRRAWSTDETPPTVVWGAGSFVSNMAAVLERRLVEMAIRGLGDKPITGPTGARLEDMAAFLSAEFDDARCAALLAGMVWVRPARLPMKKSGYAERLLASPPFAYAALKPMFTPDRTLRRIRALADTYRVPIPPGLVARLRAGGGSYDGRVTDEAVRTALARARASGLSSPFDPARAGGRHTGAQGGRIGAGLQADRLAASLLVPVDDEGLKILIRRVYPDVLSVGNDDPTAEDTKNAA